MEVDAVNTYVEMCQVNMVEVEPVDLWFEILVVGQLSVVPVKTAYGICLSAKVYVSFSGYQFAKMCLDTHGVAWHVEVNVGAHNGGIVEMNLPEVFCLCRVLWNRVVHGYGEPGILQPGSVHLDSLLVKVDATALY